MCYEGDVVRVMRYAVKVTQYAVKVTQYAVKLLFLLRCTFGGVCL